jgi:hypothetical protein
MQAWGRLHIHHTYYTLRPQERHEEKNFKVSCGHIPSQTESCVAASSSTRVAKQCACAGAPGKEEVHVWISSPVNNKGVDRGRMLGYSSTGESARPARYSSHQNKLDYLNPPHLIPNLPPWIDMSIIESSVIDRPIHRWIFSHSMQTPHRYVHRRIWSSKT